MDFITQLNQANPQAQYVQSGNIITGTWKLDANAQGALGTAQVHFDYQVDVTLNQDKTYTYTERMQSANNETGPGASPSGPTANPFGMNDDMQQNDGSINVFSGGGNSFSGKTFGNKQMGFSHQFGGKAGSNNISYNFDASKVKDPLLQALQAAGYTEQKKSFFKKLFG